MRWHKGEQNGRNSGLHLTVLSQLRIDCLAGCNSVRLVMVENAMGKGSRWDSMSLCCHACHCSLLTGHAKDRVRERGCGAVRVSLCFLVIACDEATWQAHAAFIAPFVGAATDLVMFVDVQAVNKVQGKTEEKKQEGQGCTIM